MSVWIDVSQKIRSGIPVWPGDVSYDFRLSWTKSESGSVNVGQITMSTHTGTHIDAPFHFDDQGTTAAELDPDIYIGPALVVYLPNIESIQPSLLTEIDFKGFPRLLVRTDAWQDLDSFPSHIPPVDPDLAPFLASRGVGLLGVDLPSVDAIDSKELKAHHTLYQHNIHIIEGLVLRHVAPGPYSLVALPLALTDGDGSPVRAMLKPW